MRALSLDLRERIVAAYDEGGVTQREVAGRFGVSEFTVRKLLRQRRETGDIAPRYGNCGGARKITGAHEARLGQVLSARADATLSELRDALGLDCTEQAVHYALKRMGYSYKKNAARQRTGP